MAQNPQRLAKGPTVRYGKGMLPLRAMHAQIPSSLMGLLFDLDDTVLDHGHLSEEAYSALFRLRASGLQLVAVTGRPSSWGQVIARQWPVDGIITENGAIAMRREGSLVRCYDRASSAERKERRSRLLALAEQLQHRFPELTPTDENTGRLADYAFDIAESKRVDPTTIALASAYARSQGARVVVSSIQLHIAFEPDDKASGTLRFLHQVLGVDPTLARFRYAFIGDSENDAACFCGFRTTIGVKNWIGRPTLTPRFVTTQPMGRGFVELAEWLIAQRVRHRG
ncbi:MAG: hypothetical protein RJA70_1768 [Pseudomonadota bacterium]